jgi:hypothetical protein
VLRNTALNFATGAATYALGKALGVNDHWNSGDALADAFGNALGNAIAGPYDRARMVQEQAAEIGLRMQGVNAELSARNEQSVQSLVSGLETSAPEVRERTVEMTDARNSIAPRSPSMTRESPQSSAVPEYGSDGRRRDNSADFRSYSERLISWVAPLADLRNLNQQEKFEVAYMLANGEASPYSSESVVKDMPTVQALAPDGSPALRVHSPEHYSAWMEYRFSTTAELKTMAISAASLAVPTAADALRRGTRPTGIEPVTGVLKWGGNIGIDVVNLTTLSTPIGWVLRGTGVVSDIPRFSYSTGELTAAGTVEGGLFALGLAKQLVRAGASAAEYVPFISRGVVAREQWDVAAAAPRLGVPATRASNPMSPVLEFDKWGNEIVYRSMSEEHFELLQQTGRLPATSETSTSPLLEYAASYGRGSAVLVKFTLKPGNSAQLQEIGIASNGPAMTQFPGMSTSNGKWMMTNARFKGEGGQMTTQLGKGVALKVFNSNILHSERHYFSGGARATQP